MGVFEVAVVFIISWWLILMPLLSIGTKSQAEAGDVVPGTEPGAPTRPLILKKFLWATVGAVVATFAVWLCLKFGWLNFLFPEP